MFQMPVPLALATALAVLGYAAAASGQDSTLDKLSKKPEHVADSALGFRHGSVVVAPIPMSNPTIGSGLILGSGYMFKADPGSDTSFFGIAAMGTDNGSWAAGAGASLHFGDNRWNIQIGGGLADVNYELYGFGAEGDGALEIDQEAAVAQVKLTYGITDTISVGFGWTYLDTIVTNPDLQELLDPVLPDFGVTIKQLTYGPILSYDTVDDPIYPTRGVGVTYTGDQGVGLSGYNGTFWRNKIIATGYVPVRDNIVLAAKLTGCTVSTAPFFDLCGIGITDGFRGYPAGEYLDNALASLQGAARFRFGSRWGAAVFAGAGSVANDVPDLGEAERPYAGGVGIRFRLSKKFPLDFAVDEAINANGEYTTYVRVGQAF